MLTGMLDLLMHSKLLKYSNSYERSSDAYLDLIITFPFWVSQNFSLILDY